jgi:hypothetical protein
MIFLPVSIHEWSIPIFVHVFPLPEGKMVKVKELSKKTASPGIASIG